MATFSLAQYDVDVMFLLNGMMLGYFFFFFHFSHSNGIFEMNGLNAYLRPRARIQLHINTFMECKSMEMNFYYFFMKCELPTFIIAPRRGGSFWIHRLLYSKIDDITFYQWNESIKSDIFSSLRFGLIILLNIIRIISIN